jgi:hypothetical protein
MKAWGPRGVHRVLELVLEPRGLARLLHMNIR